MNLILDYIVWENTMVAFKNIWAGGGFSINKPGYIDHFSQMALPVALMPQKFNYFKI